MKVTLRDFLIQQSHSQAFKSETEYVITQPVETVSGLLQVVRLFFFFIPLQKHVFVDARSFNFLFFSKMNTVLFEHVPIFFSATIISMNEILLLWYVPEHSTTSIKSWCTTGVRCTLARLVII